jgi:hypothetical protein
MVLRVDLVEPAAKLDRVGELNIDDESIEYPPKKDGLQVE